MPENREILLFTRFAGHYTTIIISCAPAISSFCHNLFRSSLVYRRIQSGLSLSWVRRPSSTHERNPVCSKEPIRLPIIRDNNGYYELSDAKDIKPCIETRSSNTKDISQMGIPTNPASID